MKAKAKDIAVVILFVALAALLIWFEAADVKISDDETANELYVSVIVRGVASVFTCVLFVLAGDRRELNPLRLSDKRALVWILPCVFTVLANFPYSALISGRATVARTDLIAMFLLDCLFIGIFEELLFRGIFHTLFADVFKKHKYADLWTVVATSALFGLWHLTNLFSGAAIGPTMLQVGYSFLIGAMLSTTLIRTGGNLWICILMHAVFDVGGFLIPKLGEGPFQDTVFWTLTIVSGVITTVHATYYLVKKGMCADTENVADKNASNS